MATEIFPPKIGLLLDIIEKTTGYTLEMMQNPARTTAANDARRLFCHFARVRYGFPYTYIGEILKRKHATVIHMVDSHFFIYASWGPYRNIADRISGELNRLSQNENFEYTPII